MKSIIIPLIAIFTICSNLAYSQDSSIIGKWLHIDSVMEFKSDSTLIMYLKDNPDSLNLRNIIIKFETHESNNQHILKLSMYQNQQLIKEKIQKFKIEHDKLYLPTTSTDILTGEATIHDYKTVLTRLIEE